MTGIYKIESPSGRVYIGQAVDIERRFREYQKQNSSNYKNQRRLYNSMLKYGINKHIFSVIEECSVEELNIRERYWQEFYNVLSNKGLNCLYQSCEGKSGKLSSSTKQRLSKSLKGTVPWNKGLKGSVPWNKGIKVSYSNNRAKKIIDTDTQEIFNSLTEVAIKYNIKRTTLNAMLKGQNKNKTSLRYYTDNN